MPMVYADEHDAIQLWGKNGGVDGVIQQVLNTVGFRDPVSSYEPNKTDAQVYAQYSADVTASAEKILRIPNGASQRSLTAQLKPLLSLRDRLAGAFIPGAISGSKDHSLLGQLVQGSRDFDRDLRAARSKYGQQPPKALIPEAVTPAQAAAGGSGEGEGGSGTLVLLGLAALAALALSR